MDLMFFMGDERVSGFDVSDGRRPCQAYAFDQDEQRFLVADAKTGRFSLLALDEFVADVTKKPEQVNSSLDDDKGIYISAEVRKFLEAAFAAGRDPRAIARDALAARVYRQHADQKTNAP